MSQRHFIHPLTDEYILAIGRVAVMWSYFEVHLDKVLHEALSYPEAAGLPDYLKIAFKKRLIIWRDLASKLFDTDPAHQDELINLINRASNLRGKRDYVVHGSPFTARRGMEFHLAKYTTTLKITTKLMPIEEIQNLADDITTLFLDFVDFDRLHIRPPTRQPSKSP